jgi:glycerol-3-phosphate dehydrogenase (NAD(P)+)
MATTLTAPASARQHTDDDVGRVTVFGAGAMGTALAMHAARVGLDVALWANPYDERVLEAMRSDRRHPALPEHLPESLTLFGPDQLEEAAAGCEIAILGASSAGARSLAGMIGGALSGARFAVSVAKGLESETGKRASEVYEEELSGVTIISVGGPCLAAELADGAPSASVWAARNLEDAEHAGAPFEHRRYQLSYTDDVVGLEYCTVAKNVAAIGMGILDGLGKVTEERFRNAQAAVFTRAVQELTTLVTTLGGRPETATGLPGLGDVLVTSLGGRNRLYGELIGQGEDPRAALEQMVGRGLTVEGVDSARDVHALAEDRTLDLPYHQAIYRVLFEGDDPRCILDVLG